MAFDAHKNFAYSTVATAPSPAASGTSLIVQTGDGAKFPATPFNATVWPVGTQPLSSNAEIVRVTNISGDTLTITRTQESTVARSILIGDQIANTITAKVLTDIETLAGGDTLNTVASSGSAQTVNYATADVWDITLTANCTFTLSSVASGTPISLVLTLRQDGTGSRTVTWPGSVTWISGLAPTLHTAANAIDLVTLVTFNGGTNWYGVQSATPVPFQFAEVLASEGTSSATYVDLTTPGPSVTVTVGQSGIVLLGWNTQCDATTGAASVAVSGANTIASTDNYYLRSAGANAGSGRTYVFTGLTPGSTTFKMQYRSTSGTANFQRRTIWAEAR